MKNPLQAIHAEVAAAKAIGMTRTGWIGCSRGSRGVSHLIPVAYGWGARSKTACGLDSHDERFTVIFSCAFMDGKASVSCKACCKAVEP